MLRKVRQTGFTIVELLIVIVVIGILAAIVIVAYNGVTNSAKVASVKSDLTNMAEALDIHKTRHGTYPADWTALTNAGLKATKSIYDVRNNLYYVVDTGGRWYAIGAMINNNKEYCLESGKIRENASNACNSHANTQTNVRNQATAAGVDGSAISLWSGMGLDDPTDGVGDSGWASWMQ